MAAPAFAKMKSMFFDRPAVKRNLDRTTYRFMNRYGATVRKVARRSIKHRRLGTSAPPGKPPFGHFGQLKKFLLYGFDSGRKTVVVGPTLLPRKRGLTFGHTVPEALEYSGVVGADLYTFPSGKTYRYLSRSKRKHAKRRRVKMTIREHPYMHPAAAKVQDTMANRIWAESVR
jgi:hypothetical protein